MENLINLTNIYMLEILIGTALVFVFFSLFRSFKRSLLIGQGQARFVLEEFDVRTGRIHKWLIVAVIFVLLPFLAYVKYLDFGS